MADKRNISTQEIMIGIISASIFSYFLSETLSWLSINWTSSLYSLGISFQALYVFGIAFLFISGDLILFTLLFWGLYWRRVETNDAKNVLDIIMDILLILPISSLPWGSFHILVIISQTEVNHNLIHVFSFALWVILLIIGLLLGRKRFGTWTHNSSTS